MVSVHGEFFRLGDDSNQSSVILRILSARRKKQRESSTDTTKFSVKNKSLFQSIEVVPDTRIWINRLVELSPGGWIE